VENVIEVRYAGVVVGRSTKVRDWGDAGAFIGFAEPLPSGTPLVLKGDGVEQPARVVEVIESADPAVAGMQVTFVEAGRVVRPAPKPAAAPAKPTPVAAAPAPAPVVAAPAPAPAAPVAEAALVEISSGTSSAVAGEISDGASSAVAGEVSGPPTAEHGEGDAGQGGGGGKRRRRRR
jgi:hypothetical protein